MRFVGDDCFATVASSLSPCSWGLILAPVTPLSKRAACVLRACSHFALPSASRRNWEMIIDRHFKKRRVSTHEGSDLSVLLFPFIEVTPYSVNREKMLNAKGEADEYCHHNEEPDHDGPHSSRRWKHPLRGRSFHIDNRTGCNPQTKEGSTVRLICKPIPRFLNRLLLPSSKY